MDGSILSYRYLVGVEPQVLRLECPPGEPPLYTSAVQRSTSRRSPHDDPLHELVSMQTNLT